MGVPIVTRVVTTLKWTKFCSPRTIPKSDIVREIYANPWATQSARIHVRGKVVPLIAKAMNRLYKLPNYVDDAYSTMLSEATFAQVLQTLAVQGTMWTLSGC